MQLIRSPLQCPQCTRRIFNATLDANAATHTTKTILSTFQQQQRTAWRSKQFSTSSPRLRASTTPMKFIPKRAAQPSMKTALKQEQNALRRAGQSALPEELGLLPDTFIMPEDRKQRYTLKALKLLLWHRAKDFYTGVITWWYHRKTSKPDYDLRKVKMHAQNLHSLMYISFANGDVDAKRDYICGGLASALKKRLEVRRPEHIYAWSIVRFHGRPKLVSYRAIPHPLNEKTTEGIDQNATLQAVVRIKSEQRLQKSTFRYGDVERPLIADEPIIKTNTEYVVVDKQIRNGRQGPWKIWGFAQPSSIDSESTMARGTLSI